MEEKVTDNSVTVEFDGDIQSLLPETDNEVIDERPSDLSLQDHDSESTNNCNQWMKDIYTIVNNIEDTSDVSTISL